jgi:hypothetical protein
MTTVPSSSNDGVLRIPIRPYNGIEATWAWKSSDRRFGDCLGPDVPDGLPAPTWKAFSADVQTARWKGIAIQYFWTWFWILASILVLVWALLLDSAVVALLVSFVCIAMVSILRHAYIMVHYDHVAVPALQRLMQDEWQAKWSSQGFYANLEVVTKAGYTSVVYLRFRRMETTTEAV